jgi:integrase
MRKHSPENERIKRKYFAYLKEAKRHGEPTVDVAAKALHRFEEYTGFKNFKVFHVQQAIAFKKYLADQKSQRSGEKLSKATLHATLVSLKRFFQWLSDQPGYKSCFQYTDADYFNLSEKDTRIATAQREKRAPTLEQIHYVIRTMPSNTEIERRDRALISFALLTGARDSAIASMKLKHIDLVAGCVYQDARDVNTKFSKTFETFFFSVGGDALKIFVEWVGYLKTEKLWGNDDPVFPATRIAVGANRQFVADGLERANWSSASPIRGIFREAFERAGLPYFNPHSFRNTLVRLGEERCKSPEEFKAWSQNLGHEKVLTTFLNYGAVTRDRQGEILRGLAEQKQSVQSGTNEIADAVLQRLRDAGMNLQPSSN